MAIINKPNKKGTPPLPTEVKVQNLEKIASNEKAQLKFDVSPEFKKEFKTYALDHDISMLELLQKSFEYYKGS
jgi:hypothetical protein